MGPTKLLVTGGAGYVGSHTVHHLVSRGMPPAAIVVLDNLEHGHPEFLPPGVELIRCDLRDSKAVAAVFERDRFHAVMHFAGYSLVGESMRAPERYFDNNLRGGLNLLDAARAGGCASFVFSSTCSIYGTPARLPITEEAPAAPANPYAESKRAFEDILHWYSRAHGIRSICLRYFNAAGAAYGIGEWHEPETHLIPLVLQTALGASPRVTINGDDYDTPDGTCIRDYIHVLDLADAHVRALETLAVGKVTHARLNLGTGSGTTVREIIRLAEAVSDRKVDVVVGPRRPGDPAALYADATLAQRTLGWAATKDIRAILADAWQWEFRRMKAALES